MYFRKLTYSFEFVAVKLPLQPTISKETAFTNTERERERERGRKREREIPIYLVASSEGQVTKRGLSRKREVETKISAANTTYENGSRL